MSARLIVRIHPDDRVDVRVEGLTEQDQERPPGRKLCEKVTRAIEHDLGSVLRRDYDGEDRQQEQAEDEGLKLG